MPYTIKLSISDDSDPSHSLVFSQVLEKDFSLLDFLNNTVPGWQKAIDVFTQKAGSGYSSRFSVK